MNHLLEKTYQIDTVIQRMQIHLYDKLINVWNTDLLDGYGRVYKNERSEKTIPEVYSKISGNYKEVFYNNQSCFFFVDEDNHSTEDGFVFNPLVKIVFMLNLKDLTTEDQRLDSSVQTDVISILRDVNEGFEISSLQKGIATVFRDFDTDSIKWNDIHPLHVFAIEGNLNYSVNDKCD